VSPDQLKLLIEGEIMLRSKTIREGSVGLFILLGLLVFGGVIFWLRGGKFSDTSYQITVAFEDAGGLREGATVDYRGIEVGRIVDIIPGSNGVDIVIEIENLLKIPHEVTIETSRYGLLGETVIDIFPHKQLTDQAKLISPLSAQCPKSNLILCHNQRIKGETGAQLVQTLTRLSQLYSSPEFYGNLNAAAANAALAGERIAALSDDLSDFSEDIKKDIHQVSKTADAFTNTANVTAENITKLTDEFSKTSNQINLLVVNVNDVINDNKYNFSEAIASVSDTGQKISNLIGELEFTVQEINSTLQETDSTKIVKNLEDFSQNLQEISESLNKSTNLVTLQETLDSARVTFANTAKITSDLDELTGDPEFRSNVRRLVDGLSSLLSYNEGLDKQIELAHNQKSDYKIQITESKFPDVMYIEPFQITNEFKIQSFSQKHIN
jgi:phospholipid/cholesterol/gamma-HCH transport system substrate-binding protein